MSRISVVTAVLLVLIALSATTAFAAAPPNLLTTSPTGRVSEWGQELVSNAVHWVSGTDETGQWTFNENAGSYDDSYSHVAIESGGTKYSEVVTSEPPTEVHGYFWSGLHETRTSVQLIASVYSYVPVSGDVWGTMRFRVWTGSGELIRDVLMNNMDTYTTSLTANPISLADVPTSAYKWQYSKVEAVPEPGSLLATMFGFVAFGPGWGKKVLAQRRNAKK